MNPTELEELITPFLLGDLDAEQAAEVKQLLATDPSAQQVRRDAEATLALLDEAFADRELVAKKGLAPEPVLKARTTAKAPLRIPVRLWAHAAGITILCGCIYLLFRSMLPLVNHQAAVPSFPIGEAPDSAVAAAPSSLAAGGTADAPKLASADAAAWQDFTTGRLRILDGYAADSEPGSLVLKKDGVFVHVTTGLESGMVMTRKSKTDWVREQRTGNRHWILGVSEVDGDTHALLTIVPSNGDFAANPTGWPANFKMTASENPAAIADLLLLATSYQPAPSSELSRINTIDADIAANLVAGGTVVSIKNARGDEKGFVLQTRDGFDYHVPTLSTEQAKALADKAANDIDLDF